MSKLKAVAFILGLMHAPENVPTYPAYAELESLFLNTDLSQDAKKRLLAEFFGMRGNPEDQDPERMAWVEDAIKDIRDKQEKYTTIRELAGDRCLEPTDPILQKMQVAYPFVLSDGSISFNLSFISPELTISYGLKVALECTERTNLFHVTSFINMRHFLGILNNPIVTRARVTLRAGYSNVVFPELTDQPSIDNLVPIFEQCSQYLASAQKYFDKRKSDDENLKILRKKYTDKTIRVELSGIPRELGIFEYKATATIADLLKEIRGKLKIDANSNLTLAQDDDGHILPPHILLCELLTDDVLKLVPEIEDFSTLISGENIKLSSKGSPVLTAEDLDKVPPHFSLYLKRDDGSDLAQVDFYPLADTSKNALRNALFELRRGLDKINDMLQDPHPYNMKYRRIGFPNGWTLQYEDDKITVRKGNTHSELLILTGHFSEYTRDYIEYELVPEVSYLLGLCR